LPPQSGNDGKFLTTNGVDPSWSTITLSDYLTTAGASTTYLSLTDASTNYLSITDAQNNYVSQQYLGNREGSYVLDSDRNNALGFAGLNSSGYILPQVIQDLSITGSKLQDGTVSNVKLEKNYIGLNGNMVHLGDIIQTKTYFNFNNPNTANQIGYGQSSTPNVTSPVAGDIYIQY
jgi:hypothetical protein